MSCLGYLVSGAISTPARRIYAAPAPLPGLYAEGIFTHFAVADEPDADSAAYTHAQFDLFRRVVDEVERQRGDALHHPSLCQLWRGGLLAGELYGHGAPGILLYGCGELAQGLGLRPVMTLKTTVSTIKTYGPGTDISYGRLYTTPRTTRMGVVPYGYADGFFRCLSGKCAFCRPRRRRPQRGRICMDMSMVDLTDLPEVQVGDELEVFGTRHPVGELAALAGTIPYEPHLRRQPPRAPCLPQNGAEVGGSAAAVLTPPGASPA